MKKFLLSLLIPLGVMAEEAIRSFTLDEIAHLDPDLEVQETILRLDAGQNLKFQFYFDTELFDYDGGGETGTFTCKETLYFREKGDTLYCSKNVNTWIPVQDFFNKEVQVNYEQGIVGIHFELHTK